MVGSKNLLLLRHCRTHSLPRLLSRWALFVGTSVGLVVATAAAHAQVTTLAPAASAALLRVAVTCDVCDVSPWTAGLPFIVYTADDPDADVEVVVSATSTGADTVWTFAFLGRGRFTGQDRTLTLPLPAAISSDDARSEMGRTFRVGLAEYMVRTSAGSQLEVTSRSRPQTTRDPGLQIDQWNYWVFDLGVRGSRYGEDFYSTSSYDFDVGANRVTEDWKVRLSALRSVTADSFVIDEDLTIDSRLADWEFQGLVVRSLGNRWSMAATGSAIGSTYSNEDLALSLGSGIEFDLFPYSESSRRSLTIQYLIGGSHYWYAEETVLGRQQEGMPRQRLSASLGLRQPWGQAGGSLRFSQRLDEPSQNRLTGSGNLTVRLVRGLSLRGSVSVSRIRDQFSLARGDATEAEVLLRVRQLATDRRVATSVGIVYSFGSLSNRAVNPRFAP